MLDSGSFENDEDPLGLLLLLLLPKLERPPLELLLLLFKPADKGGLHPAEPLLMDRNGDASRPVGES